MLLLQNSSTSHGLRAPGQGPAGHFATHTGAHASLARHSNRGEAPGGMPPASLAQGSAHVMNVAVEPPTQLTARMHAHSSAHVGSAWQASYSVSHPGPGASGVSRHARHVARSNPTASVRASTGAAPASPVTT